MRIHERLRERVDRPMKTRPPDVCVVGFAYLVCFACSAASPRSPADAGDGALRDADPIEAALERTDSSADTRFVADSPADRQIVSDAAGSQDGARQVTVSGEGCNDIQPGSLIPPTRLTQTPTFTGGTLEDGIYDTVAAEWVVNMMGRRAITLRFSQGMFAWVSYYESPSDPRDFVERSTGPYSVSGSTLTLSGTCGPIVDRTFSYNANGDELQLGREAYVLRMRRR